MRLLSRALGAVRGRRPAAVSPRSPRAAPAGCSAGAPCLPQARRRLSARPSLDELFATPSLRRLLEARARGAAGPELAARIQRLHDKERELRDTRELARQGAGRGGAVVAPPGGSGGGNDSHTPTRLGECLKRGAEGCAGRGAGGEARED